MEPELQFQTAPALAPGIGPVKSEPKAKVLFVLMYYYTSIDKVLQNDILYLMHSGTCEKIFEKP